APSPTAPATSPPARQPIPAESTAPAVPTGAPASPGGGPAGLSDTAAAHLTTLGLLQAGQAVLILDATLRIAHASAGFEHLFGYPAAESLGRWPNELLGGPHSDPATLASLRRLLRHPQQWQGEELLYDRAGQPRWASITLIPLRDGRHRRLLCLLSDVTSRKMPETLRQRALDALTRDAPLAALLDILCREAGRIAPAVALAVFGPASPETWTEESTASATPLKLLAAPALSTPAALAAATAPPAPTLTSLTATLTDSRELADWSGYHARLSNAGYPASWVGLLSGSDGSPLGALVFHYPNADARPDELQLRLAEVCQPLCTLALERELARSRIHHLAFYDPLTRLPNRRLLAAQAGRLIAQVARARAPLAVLFLNLDRFKQVNDTLGHAAGDTLLRETARRLRESARGGDLLGHLGGDEFALVLPQADALRAAASAERLLAALACTYPLNGITLTPTASIGISLFPEDGQELDTLLRHADLAMHQAKNGQRPAVHAIHFFRADMNRLARERLALEIALREALAQPEGLQLHYQPQVRLASGVLRGVEVLARWRHPQYGDIQPARFIALAEECGLIDRLGLHMLDGACRQLADWRRRGLAVPAVAVNLSAHHFRDPALPAQIARLLLQHGLQPADLIIEATESVMMDSDGGTLDILHALHRAGLRIAMDDFGTGYSSLGDLCRLPISELKLDRRFVADLAGDDRALALTDTVIRMGESLGLSVLAEGVETEAQRRRLQALGCQLAQGFLFARPMAAAEFEQWLGQRAEKRPR
ncbi:EAL domain-containing protein, partial [Azoarcus indigens]|nr:EAL domain-containing protein [Azoarcus indigens]